MKFLSNIYNPDRRDAQMRLAVSHEDEIDPNGRQRAWARHLEWLRDKHIGEPQGTDTYTSAELKGMGMVGVYAP